MSTTSMPFPAAPPPRWAQALFMLVPLIVGFIPPGIVFGLMPESTSRLGMTEVHLPAWVFITVWLVVYPGMGLAAFTVWRGERPHASVPLAVLACAFLITLSFWLTNGLHMTATLDAINLLLAWTCIWVFSRYSTRAAFALLPWGLWMPVTLALKLRALSAS
jgi:tryptophan-rich sensory protein